MSGLCIIFLPPLLHKSIRSKAVRAPHPYSCISLGKDRGYIKDMFNLKQFNVVTHDFIF